MYYIFFIINLVIKLANYLITKLQQIFKNTNTILYQNKKYDS